MWLISGLKTVKEFVRSYYLRWIYFPVFRRRRVKHFTECWRYPFVRMAPKGRTPELPTSFLAPVIPPDVLFYPMTDWHTRMQRSQHLARAFAQLGHRSIYLNPHLGRQFESVRMVDGAHRISCVETNVLELHLRLPREPVFHHRLLHREEQEIVQRAVAGLLKGLGTRSALQIVSFPIWFEAARAIREERGFPIVYDCHDLLDGFPRIAEEIVAAERNSIRQSDLVMFSSQRLLRHHAMKQPGLESRCLLVRNAADLPMVRRLKDNRKAAAVAGYVGAIEEWFDAAAVREAAGRNPECQFVLVGRVENREARRLGKLPNVELKGEVPHSQLPELLASFRVGLIPFVVNELTLATNPIKLYEYFRYGLPVVSMRLPEVEMFGELVYLGSNAREFALQVARAVEEDEPTRREARMRIAEEESWISRATSILRGVSAQASTGFQARGLEACGSN